MMCPHTNKSPLTPILRDSGRYGRHPYAVELIFDLINVEAAGHYIEEQWQPIIKRDAKPRANALDIPFIVNLAKEERLPIRIRDEMYQILDNLVPKFDGIS